LVLVIAMSAFTGFLGRWTREFAEDRNTHSQKFYRIVNEVPTLLMIAIVILAIVKPF
jgi:putative membrane protein